MLSVYIGQESCPSLSMQSYNTAAKFILQFLLYLIVEFSFPFLFSSSICELCVNIPSFTMLRNEGYFKHILMGHVIFTLQFVPNADFPLGRKMTVVAYHQENCRVTHMFVHFFLLFMWLLNKYLWDINSTTHFSRHLGFTHGSWIPTLQSLYSRAVLVRCWCILGTHGHISKLPRL